jgi:hypothetical protein
MFVKHGAKGKQQVTFNDVQAMREMLPYRIRSRYGRRYGKVETRREAGNIPHHGTFKVRMGRGYCHIVRKWKNIVHLSFSPMGRNILYLHYLRRQAKGMQGIQTRLIRTMPSI